MRDVLNYGRTVALDQPAYDAKMSETTPTNGDRYGYDGYHSKAAIRLYYNQHRWYTAQTGSWTSQHPFGFHHDGRTLFQDL